MTQYITKPFTYEHNLILFMSCHVMMVLMEIHEWYHDSEFEP